MSVGFYGVISREQRMRIYTRQGDDGSTGLYGGGRVSKASPRVEAYGLVDETSAVLGWARAAHLPSELDEVLARLQDDCFRLGAWLASVPGKDPGVPAIGDDDVRAVERWIDGFEATLAPLKTFVVAGGSEGAARLHVARTVARRAERGLVDLAREESVGPRVMAWWNRVSDLLFVMARAANARAGVADVPWAPRRSDPR